MNAIAVKRLLVTVFVTPVGLGQQKYDVGYVEEASRGEFRLGRFVSSLWSLSKTHWDSLDIRYELDAVWADLYPNIDSLIFQWFGAEAQISHKRIERSLDWLKAVEGFQDDDLVFLAANDDHYLLNPDAFERAANEMKVKGLPLGLVTHFPEFKAMQYRQWRHILRPNTCSVGYALGTTLVRVDFFRTWWGQDNLHDAKITRPDNPFGPSVTFPPAVSYMPDEEILRHMDGYGHIGVGWPVPALRNVLEYPSTLPHSHSNARLSQELWPSQLFGSHGTGFDLLQTTGDSATDFFDHVRVQSARLDIAWSLRLGILDLFQLADKSNRYWVTTSLVALATILTRGRHVIKVFDKLSDYPVVSVFVLFSRMGISNSSNIASRLYYLGLSRTLRLSKLLKRWS